MQIINIKKEKIMKVEFIIRVKYTVSSSYSGSVRLIVNGLKTKYYASGWGYDKQGDAFSQFINDNFKNEENKSISSKGDAISFINSIGGKFEEMYQDDDIYLYKITVNSSMVIDYEYKITKNTKGQSLVWANNRVLRVFYNEDFALEYLRDLHTK
jgi:hypothetical protein